MLALVVSATGAGLFFIYKSLSRADFFQITSIRIEGCRRTTKRLVLEWSGVDIHTNLLAMDVDAVEKKIGSHQWVEAVEIEREWPNHLTITVKERVPTAMINLHDGLYYIDTKGVVFARVLPPEDIDYPVITGLFDGKLPDVVKGSALDEALEFIRYAGRGNSVLPKQNVSEINLGADNDMVLFLTNRPFPIHLGRGEVWTKYHRLTKVLYWLYKKNEFSETTYIQMDYLPNKVLVGKTGIG